MAMAMARARARANPDGYEMAQQIHGLATFNGQMNSFAAVDNSMFHSMDWSAEELVILEEGLNTFGQHSNLLRYAKIAALLPNKTVRDVALRVQWRKKREKNRRRQEDVAKKSKDKMVSDQQREKSSKRKADSGVDKKENVIDPSGKSTQSEVLPPSLSPYAQAIAGANGQLLQRNSVALLHLDVNLNSYHQTHRNIPLFSEVRDNILKVMNNMGEMPEAYKHFPALRVKLNEELANSLLPRLLSDVRIATNIKYHPPSNM